MNQPIPKEAKVELVMGIDTIIRVHVSTSDANQLARNLMPQYGDHTIMGSLPACRHTLVVSPLYDPGEVYLYLKEIFE